MNGRLKHFGLISIGAIAGILISLGITAVAQREARLPLPLEELRQFSDVFGAIKANYVEPVEDKKLITEAISGMLSGLDPHSAYLDADAFKELQVGTQGEFGGLGIEVGVEDGFVKVVSPIEDTPAARAGVKAGDLIVKIDEKPTKGMPLGDAVKLMRGKPKTQVTLTISRKGETRPVIIAITRDVIRVQSVKSKTIEPGFGYLRVTQFQEHTVENLVKHIDGLYKQGGLKGLVLDLRNDPGGLLHGAVGVSAAFLPPEAVVTSTDGRTEDAKRKYLANPEDYMRGTRDDILLKLPAAIKLTTARYYTPSGRSIQAKGITPDYLVEETPEGDLNQFRLREADLTRHLANPKGAEEKPNVPRPSDADAAAEKLKDHKPIEYGSADDYQLQQAMNHLKGKPVMIAKAKEEAPKPEAQNGKGK